MKLFHGSDTAIEHPDVTLNTGFSDLGRGFYLTDNCDVAASRARSRARKTGAQVGIVSAYEFDETAIPWFTWGDAESDPQPAPGPFGLRFEPDMQGLAAWMAYIKACRTGNTGVPGRGEPAVVKAWIATEEVELACSGLATPAEVAEFVDPHTLVTQYCIRDQAVADAALSFIQSAQA